MTKWEYKVVRWTVGNTSIEIRAIETEALLNGLGQEGWELVALIFGRGMFFKRRIKKENSNV